MIGLGSDKNMMMMIMTMMMMMVETQNSINHIALQCQSWYMGNKEFYLMTLSAILFARWWLSNWRRGDGLLVAARYDHRDWSHQSIPFLLLHLINIHHHSINIFYAAFWISLFWWRFLGLWNLWKQKFCVIFFFVCNKIGNKTHFIFGILLSTK